MMSCVHSLDTTIYQVLLQYKNQSESLVLLFKLIYSIFVELCDYTYENV